VRRRPVLVGAVRRQLAAVRRRPVLVGTVRRLLAAVRRRPVLVGAGSISSRPCVDVQSL